MLAAAEGHVGCLRVLINAGVDRNDRDRKTGLNALLTAVMHGHADCLKLLVEVGGSNGEWKEECKVAAVNGHSECVRALVDAGADIHVKDEYGSTVIHILCYRGNMLECGHCWVHALGVEISEHCGGDHTSADAEQCWKGRVESMQILVDAGADMDAPIPYLAYGVDNIFLGMTLLQAAADDDVIEYVDIFLKAGADVNAFGDTENVSHKPALVLAAVRGHTECVNALVKAGAVNLTDALRAVITAETICWYNADDAGEYSKKRRKLECLKVLIGAKADLSGKAAEGQRSALMLAASRGLPDYVAALVDAGADVNAQDVDGVSALMEAVKAGDFECVKRLVEGGADVTTMVDKHGRTALQTVRDVKPTTLIHLCARAGLGMSPPPPQDEEEEVEVALPESHQHYWVRGGTDTVRSVMAKARREMIF